MKSKSIYLLLLALLLSVSMTAFAQDEVDVGDSIDGEASEEITEYEVELEEGQVISISIEADWDTFLELYDDDGDLIDSDDDGGDGLQSLIVFDVEDSGTYIIRVRGFSGDTPQGDFTLSIEELEIVGAVDGGELEYGDSLSVDADDALSIEVTFEGEEGDVVSISSLSDNFLDTDMTLLDPQGDDIAESATYYGDAQIRVAELEEDGTYTIIIEQAQGAALEGDIEVSIGVLEEIEVGDTIDGEASNSITQYSMELEEGQVVEISIEADWDTYLELYDDDGNLVASDDDSGGNLQSLLIFNVTDDGIYILLVRAFGADTPEGDYELTVEEIDVVQLVDGGELEYGEDEDVDADDALAVEFTFEGEEGDVITITTVSDRYLDTTMILLDSDGDDVTQSDNYYGDAIIRFFELEDDDTYTIRIEQAQGGILDGDIEVEVQLAELISLDDGEATIEIGGNTSQEFVFFTAEDDVTYELTISLDDELSSYSDVTIYVLEEGRNPTDYSDTSIRMTGGIGLSYVFETNDDGQFTIRIEYYGGDDLEVTLSIEEIDQ